MTYTPNFSDPRILSTTKRALSFVALYARSTQKSWFSRNELYKHFGNTSRPLGKYLKEQLLIQADGYYNPLTGTCKKYLANPVGIRQVQELAGLSDAFELPVVLEQQLDSGDFEYNEKSDRLFNPLQYIPKQVRGSIMANKGFTYHYDIEAAAPNLLVQRAKKLNPQLNLTHLEHYNNNRQQVRNLIALETNLSTEQIKLVINGVLQGSMLTCWQGSKLFQSLNFSYEAVNSLKHCQTYLDIQNDIKLLWRVLKEEFPKKYLTDKNGNTRSQRISAKQKSDLYRQLENEVGSVIRRLLKKRKIKCLWIHDGWCSNGFIDPLDVELEVRRLTGYSIRLDWNKYKDVNLV
jgi:hypothetical protein